MDKTNIKIYDANKSEMRIMDYKKDSQMNELVKGLGTWAYYLGLSEKTSEKELIMNAQFIREHFGSLNIVDISEAIKLSVTDPKFKENEPYGVFSPIYISKILHLYKTRKGKIIVDTNYELSKIKAEAETKPPSKEESIENMKLIINDAWQTVNCQNEPYLDFGDLLYNFILKNKLINVTDDVIAEARKYAKETIIAENRESALKSAINHQPFLKVEKGKAERKKGREYLVNYWLKSIKPEEIGLFTKKLNFS